MRPESELRRWRVAAILLASALVTALFALGRPPHPPISGDDRPLVERAIARASADGAGTPDEIRERTFPLVMETAEGPCVELRSYLPGRAGGATICYDRTGVKVRSSLVHGS